MLDPSSGGAPHWLIEHRADRPYRYPMHEGDAETPWVDRGIIFSRQDVEEQLLTSDRAFNNHAMNDGRHVSPYDEGRVDFGLDNLEVRLIQGIDEEKFKGFLSRSLRATTGIHPGEPMVPGDAEEMMTGGLQSALESQVLVFEVIGASRALTHQLVRTRKAAFHQQSQRATWYGDRPNQRWPMSVMRNGMVRKQWEVALSAAWAAYKAACDSGVSYQDARYILPEGTTNYILCEYSVREFINVFAYRGCSMFLWEMVGVMRKMREVLVAAHPFLEPHIKISCEKTGKECAACKGSGWRWDDGIAASVEEAQQMLASEDPAERGRIERCGHCYGRGAIDRKCTFQGWENVEKACDFPWARQNNRVFLPAPRNRIGG